MTRRKIHSPYNRLKGILKEKGITYGDVAKILNISETAVSYKINGLSDFYISQVDILQKHYGFNLNVFLNEKSCELNNNEAG